MIVTIAHYLGPTDTKKYYMVYTYSKKFYFVYLKFKLNGAFCILGC